MRKVIICFFLTISFLAGYAAAEDIDLKEVIEYDTQTGKVIRSGWSQLYPYQYEKVDPNSDLAALTGIDIKLSQELLRRIGYEVDFAPLDWGVQLDKLKKGELDMAVGALYTKERSRHFHYSDSYRSETEVLYMRREDIKKYNFNSVADVLTQVKLGKFNLGYVLGYSHVSSEIDTLLKQKLRNTYGFPSGIKNFKQLHAKKIDGFFYDRVVGSIIAEHENWSKMVDEYPGLTKSSKVHVIFSKRTVSKKTVDKFNSEMAEIKTSGEYEAMVMQYAFPALLSLTVRKDWFTFVDIIGTFAFAISGLLLAHRKKYSIIGALVLGSLPAVGGGVMRDVLVSREPVTFTRTPITAAVIVITIISCYVLLRIFEYLHQKHMGHRTIFERFITDLPWIRLFDALGLSAFTIVGVIIAMEANLYPLLLWGPACALITSIGGGVLRDVLAGIDNPMLKSEFYAEIAIIWGAILCLLMQWQVHRLNPQEIFYITISVFFGIFLTRIIAVWVGVKSVSY